MIRVTKEDLVRTAALRYRKQYLHWREHETYQRIRQATTEQEITEIMGNPGWTNNICTECGIDSDIVMKIGRDTTIKVCRTCLEKALFLIR